ncbi:hypothetical protein SAMN05216359_10829 [Roseateles sp. YR242]|uniref:hypothetical protein n=1 Tax=Roseateles sp. YR242 TaxID=1855305 RepID=UPI0008ABB964|nr:hypothetical protein [Roseateles sp. YR242]SEL36111.1 hypothetical protein SAMN05216359_10829 [Roseateles sp. YR242]
MNPFVIGGLALLFALPASAFADASATGAESRTALVADRGLCQPEESVYFACPTARSRWVSICGKPGTLQYRFGRPDRVELVFPAQATDGTSRLLYAGYFREKVEKTEVRFEIQGTDYVVYDYQEGRKHASGVRVTTEEGKEVEIACQGPVISRLPQLKSVIPCDKESALNGGECRR